jgi:hypothetical protein
MTSPIGQSTQSVVDIFKKVYGDLNNLVPDTNYLAQNIPFAEGMKVGDRYVEAFVLTNEVGITLAGTGQDAFDINPAGAGVVKQSEIIPSQSLMTSVLPFAFISRGAAGGDKAFFDSTKHVMKNHVKSHSRVLETMRIHGQRTALLGYTSYDPAGTVYRGATFSGDGTVTLTKSDGTTIAFTNGVNVASKAILLRKGYFAAGNFVGLEGMAIAQIDSTGAIAGGGVWQDDRSANGASGKITGVDADLGIVYVNFTPEVAAAQSGAGSMRLAFRGMEEAKEAVGIVKILENEGSLFGISAASYSLWKSNKLSCQSKKFSLHAVEVGVAQAMNRSDLDSGLKILINPRSFANLITDEAALRKYDGSYSKEGVNGFESIKFYAANGVNEIVPHRMILEGEALGLDFGNWSRSGSAEISFRVPGIDKEIIFPAENNAGWIVRSFSDQYMFCHAPARQILFTDINDEATSSF